MKFMYLGEGSTTIFGHTFSAGESVEVTDEHAVKKLCRMTTLFAHDEEPEAEKPAAPEAQKRRGRAPNAQQ